MSGSATVHPRAGRVYSRADLELIRFRSARSNAWICAAGLSAVLATSLYLGPSPAIQIPLTLGLAACVWAALTLRLDNMHTRSRAVMVVCIVLLIAAAWAVYCGSAAYYGLTLLCYLSFLEASPRWRKWLSVACALAMAVALARHFPGSYSGVDAAHALRVATIDVTLSVAMAGVFLLTQTRFLRLTMRAARSTEAAAGRELCRKRAAVTELEAARTALQNLRAEDERAIAQTRAVRDRLDASREQLEQFAYAASHDLKEPVRTIGSFVQMIRRRGDAELLARTGAADYLEHVSRNAEAMHAVLEKLLVYSRTTRHVAETVPTDVRELWLRTRYAATRDPADAAALASHRADVPARVMLAVDRTLLARVFEELLSNALTFVRPGLQPAVAFELAAEPDGSVVCRIRDDGIGIAPAYLQRVFGLFQRLNAREDYPGSGLGLAIARVAAERLGGELWLTSLEGHGTTAHVRLPADHVAEG